MNKFYIILSLFVIGVLFASCASNGDDPIPEPPGPGPGDFTEIPQNLETKSLIGTWEIYSFNKKVNANTALRYIEADGFSLTFVDETKFYESNANPKEQQHITEGTYKIITPSNSNFKATQIKFDFINRDGKSQSITRTVPFISDKRLSTYEAWGGNGVARVEDTKLWRNRETLPEGHPYVDKENVTLDRLDGIWEIYQYRRFYGSALAPNSVELSNHFVGQQYKFKGNEFSSYKDGNLEIEGYTSLVDDVLHLFYEKGELIPIPEGEGGKEGNGTGVEVVMKLKSSTFWIKDWRTEKDKVTGKEYEAFTIYDKFMTTLVSTSAIITVEMMTDVKRVK